jgi:hypothetical protein
MYSRPWINILYAMYVLPNKISSYLKTESLASILTLATLCMMFLRHSWISVVGSPLRMEVALLKATAEPQANDLYQHMRTCRKAWLGGDSRDFVSALSASFAGR